MGDLVPIKAKRRERLTERRIEARPKTVLRVGLLESDGKSSFCLLKNVSPNGIQVKLYSDVREGSQISLRVGDDQIIEGCVAWTRAGLAGIEVSKILDPARLLRMTQIEAPQSRRASPRVQTSGFAMLRTGGQQYAAKLSDISASGAKILTARVVEPGRTAVLVLPNLPTLPAFVRWTRGLATGLTFETPVPLPVLTEWLLEQRGVTEC